MRILIYKRTHRGDPGAEGIFGIHDCMGAVRDFAYDAVIGVGGIGAEPYAQGIAGKINWIGIRPRRFPSPNGRGSLVTFDHFLFYDTSGPEFRCEAPTLAARIYSRNIRILLHDLSSKEREEAASLLKPAFAAPPSRGRLRLQGIRREAHACKSPRPLMTQRSACVCRPVAT